MSLGAARAASMRMGSGLVWNRLGAVACRLHNTFIIFSDSDEVGFTRGVSRDCSGSIFDVRPDRARAFPDPLESVVFPALSRSFG